MTNTTKTFDSFQKNIDTTTLDKNQKLSITKSKEFIQLFTQYTDKEKAQTKQGSKLGAVSLYNSAPFTVEEQKLIIEYAKVLEYCENYENDLLKEINGGVDNHGDKIDNNGNIMEKLVNITKFETNAVNNIFNLGLDKLENKKIVNKNNYNENGNAIHRTGQKNELQLVSSWSLNNTFGPAFNLDIKEQENAIKEKENEINKIKKLKQSKNIGKQEAIKKLSLLLN